MNNTSPARSSHVRKIILLLIGFGLLIMLVTLVYTMYTRPTIVAHNTVAPPPINKGIATESAQEANVRLMQRIDENPTDFEALVALAEHLLHGKDWMRAELFAHRAILVNPLAMKPHYILGIVQHKKGLHKEAVASLEHALTLEDTASIRYNLGVLYAFFLKDKARAEAMLKEALKAPKGNPSLTQAIQSVMQQLVEPAQKPHS